MLSSRSLAMSRVLAVRRSEQVLRVLRVYSSTTPYNAENLVMTLRQGFPVVSVPLPSKRESCDFTLRPHLQTVGDFISNIKGEDRGVESVGVYSTEGNRVAMSTGLDMLMLGDFDLRINDFKYRVEVPQEARFGLDGENSLGDVKNMIHKLYTSLNVEKHQLSKERELRGELEQLKADLVPLEAQRAELEAASNTRSNFWMWAGVAYMSTTFGFFARLTWWEYSWDIMEPVTYFFTYGTSMAMMFYFVLTRQEYVYPDAKKRAHLNHFYKLAEKKNFDVTRYNHLKDTISEVEEKLQRLHDPLQLNLPTPPPSALPREGQS